MTRKMAFLFAALWFASPIYIQLKQHKFSKYLNYEGWVMAGYHGGRAPGYGSSQGWDGTSRLIIISGSQGRLQNYLSFIPSSTHMPVRKGR